MIHWQMQASDWLLRHIDATPTILAKTPSLEAARFFDLFYLLTVANFDPKSASLIRTVAKIDNYYTPRNEVKNTRTNNQQWYL